MYSFFTFLFINGLIPLSLLNRHKENSRIRVLMRQEKTMKVIVNHFLDPRIVLTPNVGNDKSWVWVAFDFAEEELVETVCIAILKILSCKFNEAFLITTDLCYTLCKLRNSTGIQNRIREISRGNEELVSWSRQERRQ